MAFGSPGSFLVGTDLSITITNTTTGASTLLDGRRTRFTQKADDHLIKIEPIDNGGLPDHRVLANGWSGTIEVERQSGDFDALYAALESAYYAGADQTFFIMTVTTPDKVNGGFDRFQFLGVVFHGYDPGEYQKTSATKATVQWAAQQRNQLA